MTAATGPRPDQQKQQSRPQPKREVPLLDRRYGAIGIGAVSAAMRYAGTSRNPAYARVTPRVNPRFEEFA